MTRLDDLFAALHSVDDVVEGSRATSVRLPEAVHRAALIATELGMDESFTVATSRALTERIVAFARREALAQHVQRFPEDSPTLADVVHRRARGTEHSAARRPELVADVADWVERTSSDWLTSGAVDEAVDLVLGYVEMLAAGVGGQHRAIA